LSLWTNLWTSVLAVGTADRTALDLLYRGIELDDFITIKK
jgi:hypothetical protein